MDLEQIYKDCGAYLQGHSLLSSGKHSEFYLQSAKVLENPKSAARLCDELAKIVAEFDAEFDSICSSASGGISAGYELARACNKRFIFTERVNGEMTLRRGFGIKEGERFIVCEDIITAGGSVLESAKIIESLGGKVLGFTALANHGSCAVENLKNPRKPGTKLPDNLPLFTLGNFDFQAYDENDCPFCKEGSKAIKPGSHGN